MTKTATPEMIKAALSIDLESVGPPVAECLHESDVRQIINAALAARPGEPVGVSGSFSMVAAVQRVFHAADREEIEVIAAALTKALGNAPYCWEAITGTAGRGDGCSDFFFMEKLAGEYVRRHGGYIKPLYAAPPADKAEIERLRQHVEELQAKIDGEKDCACSYDEPGIVCVVHSPRLVKAEAEIERLRAALASAAKGAISQLEACNEYRVEIEQLRAALEYYANPRNWIDSPSWDGDPGCFTPKAIPVIREVDGSSPCDCGDTARAALAQTPISLKGTSHD